MSILWSKQEQDEMLSKSEKQTKVDSNGAKDGENQKAEPASVKTTDTKQPEPKPISVSQKKISPVPDSANAKPQSTIPDSLPDSTTPPSTVPKSVPDSSKPSPPWSEPTTVTNQAPSQDPAPVKIQEDQGDASGHSAPPPVVRQNSRRVPPGGHTSGGFW